QFALPGGEGFGSALGSELVLTNAVSPQFVLWYKGTVGQYSNFRWQVSENDGADWSNIVSLGTVSEWTRYQLSLSAYVGKTIRLRYITKVYFSGGVNMSFDDIGIGEPAPDAPMLSSPEMYESVLQRRPTVSVTNAIDYQGDNLDYEIEVYSDIMLSNLVANVPVLASGDEITSWQVDQDLPDDAQYWWRCRATDGLNTGAWMTTASFYVNQSNTPPSLVELVGPPADSILHDTSYKLFWYPSTDSDMGDYVIDYEIQISDSSDFSNIVVDENSIVLSDIPTSSTWVASCTLESLTGSENLVDNTRYYWRMRARDHWLYYGAWSQENMWFIFGTPPPTVNSFNMNIDGLIVLDWERSGTAVYIEYKEDLMSTDEWSIVAGPIYGTNIVISPLEDKQSGYYRVITAE
nr:hypothetical protein [Kiritimatiellia bacterium]